MKVDVILPAGGRLEGGFAKEAGAGIKALIALGGQTILERTLHALQGTGRVERMVVIGPEALQGHPATRAATIVLPEGATGPENIFRGLQWLRENESSPTGNGAGAARRVLIVTTDLPFLSSLVITQFLDACPPGAAIALPIIARRDFETLFADSEGVYVRLRDGEWTLGCAFLVDPAALEKSQTHLERVFAARKSQFLMARLLGPLFIARFLLRRLEVVHIEERCRQILGVEGVAVLGCPPELAFDIDLPEEYRYAVRHVAHQENPS